MIATCLVLIAALLHAIWNTLVKFSADRLLVIVCIDMVGLLAGVLLLPFAALPPAAIWPWLLASVLLETLYRLLLIRAYHHGDLGLVYPLMRGLSPLVVLLLTLGTGGEALNGGQILGILLIPLGMLVLVQSNGGIRRLPAQLWPAVAAIGLCIGGYTWIDGQALRRWPDALSYLAWVVMLSAMPFPCYGAIARRRDLARFWQRQWRLGLTVGLCTVFSYGLVLAAMALGSVAEAAALREISVVLAMLLGVRFLKESFGWDRLCACLVVFAGILIMRMS